MKTSEALTYTHEPTGVVAQWSGGMYVDLGHIAETDGPWNSSRTDRAHYAGDFVPLDVINVGDNSPGHERPPFGASSLQRIVDQHMDAQRCHYCGDEADQDEVMHDSGDGLCESCGIENGWIDDPEADEEEDGE